MKTVLKLLQDRFLILTLQPESKFYIHETIQNFYYSFTLLSPY